MMDSIQWLTKKLVDRFGAKKVAEAAHIDVNALVTMIERGYSFTLEEMMWLSEGLGVAVTIDGPRIQMS